MTVTARMTSPLAQVREAIEHLNHLLPGQGPILNFVHHNTIHGFQHLPFLQALSDFEKMTGIRGYMGEEKFRQCYHRGRICDADLGAALLAHKNLDPDTVLGETLAGVSRGEVYRAALLHPLKALSAAQLQWQLVQGKALDRPQKDVPLAVCNAYEVTDEGAPAAMSGLWRHILENLEIPATQPGPEEGFGGAGVSDTAVTAIATADMAALLAQTGDSASLASLVCNLSGIDTMAEVRPVIQRLSASLLDEGTAAWHVGDNRHDGLYPAWRESLPHDAGLSMTAASWREETDHLPGNAEEAVVAQLERLRLPRDKWGGYLSRLCLEMPGWTGLINWRQQNPGYHSVSSLQPRLADWLAVRLTLDRLQLQRVCRQLWQCDGHYEGISDYVMRHPVECWVRRLWQQGNLPEALSRQAAELAASRETSEQAWLVPARQILGWRNGLTGSTGCQAHDQGWRLFRLCQFLGIGARHPLPGKEGLLALLALLEDFDVTVRSQVWLLAYEKHYRDDLFQAILANDRRGHWVDRTARAEAQIVMCMDEREESFRRHLEEINPQIETLGAAGFFGVPMKYKALDDTHLTPLCPVVVTPAHRVEEIPRTAEDPGLDSHRKGFARLYRFAWFLHQGCRLNPLRNFLATFLLAPVSLAGQLLHSLLPGTYKALVDTIRRQLVTPVTTCLTVTTDTPDTEATTDRPRLGFTDQEQAQRVATLLRTLGLTRNFAPLVVLSGHGSTSQNNPHEAAHDCGACGGRQGGPNARAFAAMANRNEVRHLLAADGIAIPADTWFIGTQHDTCSDAITWYDTDLVPEPLRDRYRKFRQELAEAQALSAHERCRRFRSAADPATPAAAFRHVTLRSRDLSQVRPEYGHATNASAIIGRRNLTQGLFLDRRSFLISYDPTQDPEGKILENILLTAGPVGAGINLEYYFSTIDNDRFGCGTKIPHNVTGLFGVMEGTGSDLRTGLPEQMVEIHEPMRLLVLVEHRTTVLERIYGDQPALQELIGGGWLILAVKDPDSEAIHLFDPDAGFVRWTDNGTALPQFDKSTACYAGIHTPIAPVLITRPARAGG